MCTVLKEAKRREVKSGGLEGRAGEMGFLTAKQSVPSSTWVGIGSSKTSSLKLVGDNTILTLTT